MLQMRNFWALPAVLRVAIAAQAPFSVHNDILAFPQYDVVYSDSYISEADARSLLTEQAYSHSTSDGDIPTSYDVQTQHRMDGEPPRPQSKDQYERMMFEDIPYLCTIPEVGPASANNATKSEEEHQQELARASNQGWELLQGMRDQCLYYSAGWWVYSFCFNQGIKQFHPLPPGSGGVPLFPPVEDKQVGSYTLGKFEETPRPKESLQAADEVSVTPSSASTETPTPGPSGTDLSTRELSTPQLQTRGETNFLVQTLDGGTTCDLTGRPRRVEVQFHCNPSAGDRINMIKETASCVYLMVIHTPRLCNDVAFLPPQVDKPNPITCQEIVVEEDIGEWKAWKAESVKAQLQELQRQTEASTAIPPPPIFIGGVEVGAQKLVGGSPERTIKASKIITSNPSSKGKKFIATLASSDGKTVDLLSDEEFEKLGIKEAKVTVEEYLSQSKSVRSGSPWKLDLYGTAQGWEFIMIIGVQEMDLKPPAGKEKSEDEDEAGDDGSEEEYK